MAALEQQIAAVNERVARTEHQLGHLETIERTITQLCESVDQNRNMAREIAEDAVNRMAERFTGMQAPAHGPSPELQALEEGLRAVGETAASAESRNQETLLAVHETLEQIVVKLSELETASAGHQLALAMVQQATARAPEPQVQYQPQPQSPEPVAAQQYGPQPAAPPPLTHKSLLEPQPPAFEQMPPVAAMPPHLAASVLDPGIGDDYIDAARRAAHAAAHNVDFIDTTAALEAGRKAVGRKSKFKLPFLKSKAGTRPKIEPPAIMKPVPILKAPNDTAGKRRKLLIAGIVLLAAVSALTFTMLGRTSKPPQSGAVEGTVKPMVALPAIPGASVSAIFIDPIAAAAAELFTASLPPQKDPALSPIVSEKKTAATSVEMPPEAIGSESLRRAAAKGDAVAQFIIAGRYLDGKPVPQDYAKAAYWYREAAARGLAPAQYRVASLFERGKGVAQDMAAALLWYERAAAAGNIKAMHNAAVIAASGKLGKPDYTRAFKWFSAAAAHGLKDSQFNLAVLYDRGLGTKADPAEALFWYALAGRQNDADAKKRAAAMMATLQPSAAAVMRRRIGAWTPKPSLQDANTVTVTHTDWKYEGVREETRSLPRAPGMIESS